MPFVILGVGMAEPPTASRTANRGGMRAWLVVTRYGLTEMLQVRACWFVLSHQHASDRNSIGRLPSTLLQASSCFCFVGESARLTHDSLSRCSAGTSRHFVCANFYFIGVLGILYAHYHLGFERVSFFEQLIHALRVRTFYVGQSLQIS